MRALNVTNDDYSMMQQGGYLVDTDHNTTSAITYTLRATSNS